MKPSPRFLFTALCVLFLHTAGCHTRNAADVNPSVETAAWIKSELYFGLSKPDGTLISAPDWQCFLDEQVTPVFSEGLTVIDANGQYKSRSGIVCKEPARLVIAVYKPSAERDAAIRALIAAYKKQFQQESVLWTTSKVEAQF